MHERPQQGADIPIDAKVAFLKRGEAYPDRPNRVEAIETHMSWVFLAGSFAYKLKKPVRYEFLDFSSVEARRLDCEEELRLNRRLAPDVYLATVPLTADRRHGLVLGGQGEVVDWLVKMRRLPEHRMLDKLIAARAVDRDELDRAIALLASFYSRLPPALHDPVAYVQRLRAEAQDNAREVASARYHLPADRFDAVLAAQVTLLDQDYDAFAHRVRQGRIIEGHGDLRPEHICLLEQPVVIDCLEFNREFRILDMADELAFLALECERLGAGNLSATIFEIHERITGDRPPSRLVSFYKSYRACLRAKLAIWHLRDAQPVEAGKWPAMAMTYLGLAEKYAAELT